MTRLPAPALLATALWAGWPALASAQVCHAESGVAPAVSIGHVVYTLNPDQSGLELGGEVTAPVRDVVIGLSVALFRADNDARTLSVRSRVGYSVFALGNARFCALAHAGASSFDSAHGSASSLGGGLGAGVGYALTTAGIALEPYLAVRGLAVRTAGTLVDVDFAATGLALGAEVGVAASLARLTVRAEVSANGFAAGLGTTPYPQRAVRLVAGVRF